MRRNDSILPLLIVIALVYFVSQGGFPGVPGGTPDCGFIVYNLNERPAWLNILEAKLKADERFDSEIKSIDADETAEPLKKWVDEATGVEQPALLILDEAKRVIRKEPCPTTFDEFVQLWEGK